MKVATLVLLLSMLLASALFAMLEGPVDLNIDDLMAMFSSRPSDPDDFAAQVLWDIRLPRILMTLIVGAGLSVSGAVMQGLFRNPLAEPGLIGVSAGAALGAGMAIVLGSVFFEQTPIWFLPFSAFCFGLAVTYVVFLIANRSNGTQIATLLLAGVAMQALAGASIGLLSYIADDRQLRDLTFWNLGSFGASSWTTLQIAAVIIIPCIIILLYFSRHLNAMLLGEDEARHLGIPVESVKKVSIVLVSLLVAASVSSVGIIAFVGLVVPHLVRLAFGSDHHFLLPASAALGALLLLIADTVARTAISPAELPIGIITAFVGCPFFFFLILRQRHLLF